MKKAIKIMPLVLAIVLVFSACSSGVKKTDTKGAKIGTATISIEAKKAVENIGDLKEEKKSALPSDGIILEKTDVEIHEGDTVYTVFKAAVGGNTCKDKCELCKSGSIPFHEVTSPSVYIDEIHGLCAGDCGKMSGWTYTINGEMVMDSADKAVLKDGDEVLFSFVHDFD